MNSIPVVDISTTRTEGEIAIEVDKALSTFGFVYLKNHGIAEETVKKVFKESKQFSSLEDDLKLQCHKSNLTKEFGYDPLDSVLNRGGNKCRETFNIPSNIEPNLEIPDCATKLVTSMKNLTIETQPLLERILRIFSKSLQLDDSEYFVKKFNALKNMESGNISRIKSCFYPYMPEITVGTERCITHFDTDLLTFLWNDGHSGLQIFNCNEEWIDIETVPGTILVNTGSMLTYWSGGRYPATVHRVVLTEEELYNKNGRQSIAYFVIPDDEVRLFPLLPELPNYKGEIPHSEQGLTVKEYMEIQFEKIYLINKT